MRFGPPIQGRPAPMGVVGRLSNPRVWARIRELHESWLHSGCKGAGSQRC